MLIWMNELRTIYNIIIETLCGLSKPMTLTHSVQQFRQSVFDYSLCWSLCRRWRVVFERVSFGIYFKMVLWFWEIFQLIHDNSFNKIKSINNNFIFVPKNIRFILVLSILVTVGNSYKVLFLAPFNGKSHWIYLQNFVRALLNRGHEVTFLTSIPLDDIKSSNYTQILIDPPLDLAALSKRNYTFFYEKIVWWYELQNI